MIEFHPQFFPPGSVEPRYRLHDGVYAEFLTNMRESSMRLDSVADGYRYFAIEGQYAGVVRLDLNHSHAVCKRIANYTGVGRNFTFESSEVHLTSAELTELSGLIHEVDFWALDTVTPVDALGGRHHVVEASVGGRYHVVDRWCPSDTPIGELCEFFVRIHKRAWGIVDRSWWQKWLP